MRRGGRNNILAVRAPRLLVSAERYYRARRPRRAEKWPIILRDQPVESRALTRPSIYGRRIFLAGRVEEEAESSSLRRTTLSPARAHTHTRARRKPDACLRVLAQGRTRLGRANFFFLFFFAFLLKKKA